MAKKKIKTADFLQYYKIIDNLLNMKKRNWKLISVPFEDIKSEIKIHCFHMFKKYDKKRSGTIEHFFGICIDNFFKNYIMAYMRKNNLNKNIMTEEEESNQISTIKVQPEMPFELAASTFNTDLNKNILEEDIKNNLSDHQQLIYDLWICSGMKPLEISKFLGYSKKTNGSYIYRQLNEIRKVTKSRLND